MPFGTRSFHFLLTGYFLLFLFCGCKKEKLDWQHAQQLDSHTTDRLNEVIFINNQTGFAIGGQRFNTATLLTTNDSGNTWSAHNLPEAGKGLYGISTDPNGTVYICGFDGKLLYSADAGATWQFSQLSIWDSYKELVFTAPGKGIAIGGISFSYGFITHLENKDISKYDSMAYELNDIEMVNDKVGYISGFGVVLKTTDGGDSWTQLDIKNDNFSAIYILNEQAIWICGYNGSIYFSANAGAHWEKLRGGNAALGKKYRLLDIMFTSATDGWATGENGLVLYTRDGGHNWDEYKHFTSEALRSITQAPDGNIIVAGDNGTLYKLNAK